jgi:hypothetical protein
MSLAIVRFGHLNQRGPEQEAAVGWKSEVVYDRTQCLQHLLLPRSQISF